MSGALTNQDMACESALGDCQVCYKNDADYIDPNTDDLICEDCAESRYESIIEAAMMSDGFSEEEIENATTIICSEGAYITEISIDATRKGWLSSKYIKIEDLKPNNAALSDIVLAMSEKHSGNADEATAIAKDIIKAIAMNRVSNISINY